MKAYTDLNQSKKLAEILPLESADMYFAGHQSIVNPKEWDYEDLPKVRGKYIAFDDKRVFFPCWSLAALLSVIRETIGYTLYGVNNVYMSCDLGDKPWKLETEVYDNEVDACYEMIIKLHEQKLL